MLNKIYRDAEQSLISIKELESGRFLVRTVSENCKSVEDHKFRSFEKALGYLERNKKGLREIGDY